MPKPKPKPAIALVKPFVSPCDRGNEIPAIELTIRNTDPLALFFQVCAGVGQVTSHLTPIASATQTAIGEAKGVGEKGVTLNIPTSALTPGRYILTWTFRVDGEDDWTTAHELVMGLATVFRLYKRRASNRPVNTLFMSLVVL
jgi:hypothetical protein